MDCQYHVLFYSYKMLWPGHSFSNDIVKNTQCPCCVKYNFQSHISLKFPISFDDDDNNDAGGANESRLAVVGNLLEQWLRKLQQVQFRFQFHRHLTSRVLNFWAHLCNLHDGLSHFLPPYRWPARKNSDSGIRLAHRCSFRPLENKSVLFRSEL